MSKLSDLNARKLRAKSVFHLPPGAQPLNATVTLDLEVGADVKAAPNPTPPLIVLTDSRRNYSWQVAMSEIAANHWQAHVMLPSEVTIVKYHFVLGDEKILERRQVEGISKPVYDEWVDVDYKIAVYDPAKMPAAWTQGMMIYQIFPDRFANSDPQRPLTHNGVYGAEARFMQWGELPEAPPTGRDFFGGDLQGIIQKLDYLQALGVEVLYLNPIFEASTNHRYEAIDFTKIDPMLGTEADFDALIEAAHARGIKIILDAVFNHCSSDSVYFDITGKQTALTGVPGAAQSVESPYYRWFKFREFPTDYDGWWGYGFMPEFVESPEMEAFFLGENGITRHWLRKGIDGWRCDVAFDNTLEFWQRFRKAVDAEKPDAYTVSEEWGDSTHYLLGDTYNATMNYRFTWAVRGFLATGDLTPSQCDDRLQTWLRDTPPPAVKSQMNLLDSHDTDRLLTACGGNRARYLAATAFQLAYIGAPCVYYGNETGLEGAYAEDGRRCMPWEALDSDLHATFTHFINTRNASNALRLGDVETVVIDDAQRVYGFVRRYEDETVYAVFNGSEAEASVEITAVPVAAGTYQDMLGNLDDVQAAGDGLRFTLPPLGMVWYRRMTAQ